jgi:hypothetical protein
VPTSSGLYGDPAARSRRADPLSGPPLSPPKILAFATICYS